MIGVWIAIKYQAKYGIATKDLLLIALYTYTVVVGWGLIGFTGIIGYVYSWEVRCEE